MRPTAASVGESARPSPRRWVRALLTIVLVIAALPVAAVWGFNAIGAFAIGCGDACGVGDHWTDEPRAWQRTAQFVLAVLGIAALVAAPFAVGRGRVAVAAGCAASAAALAAVWLALGTMRWGA